MERLTYKTTNIQTGDVLAYGLNSGCNMMLKGIQKLGAYEDAEEQGLLLRLPYPFGTKLYYVIDDWEYGMSVNEVIFDLKFVSDVLRYPDEYYLTREEADRALKQMGE